MAITEGVRNGGIVKISVQHFEGCSCGQWDARW